MCVRICCTSFRRIFSAHCGEFPQNFRNISATFAGAVETNWEHFPQKFLLEVKFAVRGVYQHEASRSTSLYMPKPLVWIKQWIA